MKIANAFSLLTDLWFGITIAFLPTFKAFLKNPLLLLKPHKLSSIYLANLWLVFGDGIDGNAQKEKEKLITPYAYGAVLDIGAGHGHTVRYLDRKRVTRYVALEPNTLMHSHIRAHANGAGFHESDGTLVVLSCGAENTRAILAALAPADQPSTPVIDTIVSILTLCTIPSPNKCIADLVRDVMKPGGQFLMYEHVLSKRADVAWWQRFWAPLWSLGFDGCRLDRPSDVTVSKLELASDEGRAESPWRESQIWGKEGEDEENLFFHSSGRFVKR